jgi:glycosyltransferase involved in cell wall biosynthesis
MNIGFIDNHKASNPRAWSGTYKSIIDELRKRHTLDILYPKFNFFEKEYFFEQRNFYRWIRKKDLYIQFLKDYSKLSSRKLDKLIEGKKYDLLIAPASNQRFAYSKTNIPIICIIDSTFKTQYGYYVFNIPKFNARHGIETDKLAFEKASHILAASDWAAQSVIKYYGIPPSKVSVNLFGANLEHIPYREEIQWSRTDTCRLLFLGVEWIRKGGDIAVEALRFLHKKNIKATLTIVGCVPPEDSIKDVENIMVIPFLNKQIPEQEKALHELLINSDFLLLPSRAEAAGIVFCESCAFGLPVVSTNTGGVSNYVIDAVNGFLLNKQLRGEAYADIIIKAFTNTEEYLHLRQNARQLFEERLNWCTWGKHFEKVATSIISNNQVN